MKESPVLICLKNPNKKFLISLDLNNFQDDILKLYENEFCKHRKVIEFFKCKIFISYSELQKNRKILNSNREIMTEIYGKDILEGSKFNELYKKLLPDTHNQIRSIYFYEKNINEEINDWTKECEEMMVRIKNEVIVDFSDLKKLILKAADLKDFDAFSAFLSGDYMKDFFEKGKNIYEKFNKYFCEENRILMEIRNHYIPEIIEEQVFQKNEQKHHEIKKLIMKNIEDIPLDNSSSFQNLRVINFQWKEGIDHTKKHKFNEICCASVFLRLPERDCKIRQIVVSGNRHTTSLFFFLRKFCTSFHGRYRLKQIFFSKNNEEKDLMLAKKCCFTLRKIFSSKIRPECIFIKNPSIENYISKRLDDFHIEYKDIYVDPDDSEYSGIRDGTLSSSYDDSNNGSNNGSIAGSSSDDDD